MKYAKWLVVTSMLFLSPGLFAQTQTDTIKVYGNCGMCKARIEKTLKLEGISSATWNPETKLLFVSYDQTKISNDDIQKAVAAVGHDTEKYNAADSVYSKLPGCCLYKRKNAGSEPKQ